MEFTFSHADAQVLYGLFASVLVPFIVALLAKSSTPKEAKVVIAVVVSILAGALSQYVAGELDGGSVVVAAVGVFTASQAHFTTWFSSLGINDALLNLGKPTD